MPQAAVPRPGRTGPASRPLWARTGVLRLPVLHGSWRWKSITAGCQVASSLFLAQRWLASAHAACCAFLHGGSCLCRPWGVPPRGWPPFRPRGVPPCGLPGLRPAGATTGLLAALWGVPPLGWPPPHPLAPSGYPPCGRPVRVCLSLPAIVPLGVSPPVGLVLCLVCLGSLLQCPFAPPCPSGVSLATIGMPARCLLPGMPLLRFSFVAALCRVIHRCPRLSVPRCRPWAGRQVVFPLMHAGIFSDGLPSAVLGVF